MSRFISYYWQPSMVSRPELSQAVATLTGSDVPVAELQSAFGLLLASDCSAAQGIAFDHFVYAEAQGRHGRTNPFQAWAAELRDKSRAQLEMPPASSISPIGGIPIEGANHASALGVLIYLGEEEDLARIESVITSSRDESVLQEAMLAVGRCLQRSRHTPPTLLQRLAGLAQDPSLSDEVRGEAISALAESPEALAEETLVEIATTAPLPFSAQAAVWLGQRDLRKYQVLLQRLSDQWPEDAGYPVPEVRELLQAPGDEELQEEDPT